MTLYPQLSKPAEAYARAVSDPINGPLACIPSYPALMTAKRRYWCRGVMGTSDTTGIGFVACNPQAGAFNDLNAVYYTDATFAGTTLVGAGTGVDNAQTNSEFASTAVTATFTGITWRQVGGELRVRYIGTELDRGGQIVAYVSPVHQGLGGQNISGLESQIESRLFPVTREWTSLLYRPYFEEDLELSNAQPPANSYMAVMVAAPSMTTSISFEWEYWGVYEFQGQAPKNQTPSHFDPTGFAAVHQAAQLGMMTAPTNIPGPKRQEMMVKESNNFLSNVVSWVIANGAKIAEVAGTALSLLA